jgi:hypothetical protein
LSILLTIQALSPYVLSQHRVAQNQVFPQTASAVGLEGRTLVVMAFTVLNGRATWNYAGKR